MGCSPRDPPCEGPPTECSERVTTTPHCALERGRAPQSELHLKLRKVSGPDGLMAAVYEREPSDADRHTGLGSASAACLSLPRRLLWDWGPLPAQCPLPGPRSHPAGGAGLGEPQVRFTELSLCRMCNMRYPLEIP